MTDDISKPASNTTTRRTVHTVDATDRARRIAVLNDRLRCSGEGGVVTITAGITALSSALVERILIVVATFSAFNADNDPWGEHDCAVMEVEGHRVIWKIDYYDPTLTHGSEDPTDARRTRRVLTVMLGHEY